MSSLKGITPLLASSKQILSEKNCSYQESALGSHFCGSRSHFFSLSSFVRRGSYVDPWPKVGTNLLVFIELIAFWSCRWGSLSISTLYDLLKDIALPHSRLFSALRAWPICGGLNCRYSPKDHSTEWIPFLFQSCNIFSEQGRAP